ncbi:MAG TPA: hypothetical protein VN448_02030 [Gammaproteobacteria bacterium]|nr:hypothetical protein [Gammaproteobacteria bacterium]
MAGKELATETTDRTDKFFPAMKERKKHPGMKDAIDALQLSEAMFFYKRFSV